MSRGALEDAQEALRWDPQCVQAHVIKFQALRLLGKKDEALQCMEQIQKLAVMDLCLFEWARREMQEKSSSSSEKVQPMPHVSGAHQQQQQQQFVTSGQDRSPSSAVNDRGFTVSARQSGKGNSGSLQEIMQNEQILLAAAAQLQGGIGDLNVDKLIILGYFKVNNGMYLEAIDHFNQLILSNPTITAAYVD